MTGLGHGLAQHGSTVPAMTISYSVRGKRPDQTPGTVEPLITHILKIHIFFIAPTFLHPKLVYSDKPRGILYNV